MNISNIELLRLMVDVAIKEFDHGIFRRRQLMNKVEQELKNKCHWDEEYDDIPSNSRGIKSRGLARIDYAFTPLKTIHNCLIHVDRDQWRVIEDSAPQYK